MEEPMKGGFVWYGNAIIPAFWTPKALK